MATMTEEQIKKQYSDPYMTLRDTIMSGKGTTDILAQMEGYNRQANQARGQGDKVTATKDLEYLKGMIPTQTTTQATTQPMTQPNNNIDMIKDSSKQLLASIVSQIKATIAQSRQGYNNIIQDAPAQFQQAKNTSELNRVRGLDTLRETIANNGERGDIGRSQLQTADINSQNQLLGIQAQQDKVITDAQRAIQNLEEQGRYQEAQATADNAYQMLQAIIQEGNRAEEMKLNIGQLLGTYNGNRTLQGQEFDYQKTQDELNRQDRLNDTEWERSSANPAYQAQLIQNEIDALTLANLPQQIKDEAAMIQLQLQQGRIDLDTAREQLRRLKKTPIGGYSSSSSSSSNSAGDLKSSVYVDAYEELNNQFEAGTADAWFKRFSPELKQQLTPEAYLKLYNEYLNYKAALKKENYE